MNCIIVDDDDASRAVITQMVKQVEYLNVIKTCSTPVEAINTLRKENIDLLFLDIEMPEMNGMEMLKALDNKPQVILITSHTEYALDAFDLNVADYLIKPITLPRFLKALAKVKASATEDQVNMSRDWFFIKKNSVLHKVPVKDILWIEALGDYITVHTKDERFIIHATLKSLETKLHTSKFVRVHRSYIVQIENIKKVEDTTIFINDTSIPVGALYKENFIKQINTLQ
jgi:DNA-binding LytR/AlgR family response regulator